MESTKNPAIMYILIRLPKEQRSLVVTQSLPHASTTSDHAQLRHYSPILLCLGDVTLWNIRLYNILIQHDESCCTAFHQNVSNAPKSFLLAVSKV